MILVTVGYQMPFDRLVRAVDDWAGTRPGVEVLAQIGRTRLRPRHLQWVETLAPAEFARTLRAADHVVAHAGMGTILAALQAGKPIVVLPRRAALRETRSEHQLATARRLHDAGRVHAAFDEDELRAALDALPRLRGGRPIPGHASPGLLDALRGFVEEA